MLVSAKVAIIELQGTGAFLKTTRVCSSRFCYVT